MTRKRPHRFTDRSSATEQGLNDVDRVVRCVHCGVENVYRLNGQWGQRWRRPGGEWTARKIDCEAQRVDPASTTGRIVVRNNERATIHGAFDAFAAGDHVRITRIAAD